MKIGDRDFPGLDYRIAREDVGKWTFKVLRDGVVVKAGVASSSASAADKAKALIWYGKV